MPQKSFFAVLVIVAKVPSVAPYELFSALVGTLFAIGASALVMDARLKNHELKPRYETMSKQDTLSSLYNKRAFFEIAKRYIEAHNLQSTCSLGIIDIDNFKYVNDTYGHVAGDRILASVGDVLAELFRPTDLIARFGGDEYLVIADRLIDSDLIERRFDELCARVEARSREVVGTPISVSVGVVCAHNQEVDFGEMFRQADIALYQSKDSGKSACVVRRYCENPLQEDGSVVVLQHSAS